MTERHKRPPIKWNSLQQRIVMLRNAPVFILAGLFPLAQNAAADVTFFATPSGNIECSAGEERASSDITCEIFATNGPPELPRPAGCTGPYGYRVSMTHASTVTVGCGGPARPAGSRTFLNYGEQIRFYGLYCDSSRQGLVCRNAAGHGFMLSRALQNLF